MRRLHIAIVCPATAQANNGNWRTAVQWQRALQAQHDVRIVPHWPDAQAARDDQLWALHARKSAPSIRAWHQERGAQGLAVVLTGTDLYPDITSDPAAMRSVEQAAACVVLQALGVAALPDPFRHKTHVIEQSVTPPNKPSPKRATDFRVVMVGHLRHEKNPSLLWRALAHIPVQSGVVVEHIGHALEPQWAERAQQAMRQYPHYRWLGGLSHETTLHHIQQARLLVHTSHQEGAAIVLAEAVCCSTPVLATRIAGHVGTLGADYAGFVTPDDERMLAAQVLACAQGHPHRPSALLVQLQQQGRARAPWFAPAREQGLLLRLAETLAHGPVDTPGSRGSLS